MGQRLTKTSDTWESEAVLYSRVHRRITEFFETTLPRPAFHYVKVDASQKFAAEFGNMGLIFTMDTKQEGWRQSVEQRLFPLLLERFVDTYPNLRFFVRSDFILIFHHHRKRRLLTVDLRLKYFVVDVKSNREIYERMVENAKGEYTIY